MSAQLYVSADASISIDNSAIVSVIGDAKNDGTILNPGTIYLKGNLDNQNILNSTGTFILSGLNQSIYHKNTVFSTLICNGGGIKKFISSVTITTQLDLNDGLLKPLDSTTLLLKSTANTTLGNSDSYVDGKLFTEGRSNRYFPIGKGGLFAPCELQNIVGDSAIIYGIDVVNPTTLALTKGKLSLGVLQTRYWKMTNKRGAFTQGNISLSYNNDDIFIDPDLIGVVQAADSVGPYDMLKKNADIVSRISGTGLMYSTNAYTRPLTKKFFTLGDFSNDVPFFVPNALSKHALDSNDRAIRIYGGAFDSKDFSFIVSNQWGNVVYKTNSVKEMIESGWDGTNNRTQRHETIGQYLYVLKGKRLDGEPIEKAGSIWIIE